MCSFLSQQLLPYIESLVCSSFNETVPQPTCYVSFLTLIFHKIMEQHVWSLMDLWRSLYCRFTSECASIEICQYLAKIWTRIAYSVSFFTHDVVSSSTISHPNFTYFLGRSANRSYNRKIPLRILFQESGSLCDPVCLFILWTCPSKSCVQ